MNIIISGASRGIGKELARKFAQNTDNKLFLIARNKEKLDALINECKTEHSFSQVHALPFDLANTHEIKDLVAIVKNEVAAIDIIINNAGFLIKKPFEDTLISDMDMSYKINVLAAMELTRCFMPLLKKSKIAHIVNIGSMGGYQGSTKFTGLSSYSSSKGALAVLTECLAEEYKHTSIKFNCLALGAVATEMLAEAFPGYEALTTAAEMAEFICDFALNGHNMFNGKILPVSKTTP